MYMTYSTNTHYAQIVRSKLTRCPVFNDVFQFFLSRVVCVLTVKCADVIFKEVEINTI